MFKIGQRVRYSTNPFKGLDPKYWGKECTVIGIGYNRLMVKFDNEERAKSVQLCNLSPILKEDCVPYNFIVPHPSQIDADEIYVDREHPAALIRINNEWYAKIHKNLVNKARILNRMKTFHKHFKPVYNINLYRVETFNDEALDFIRSLRQASWGKKRNECAVFVGYPNV